MWMPLNTNNPVLSRTPPLRRPRECNKEHKTWPPDCSASNPVQHPWNLLEQDTTGQPQQSESSWIQDRAPMDWTCSGTPSRCSIRLGSGSLEARLTTSRYLPVALILWLIGVYQAGGLTKHWDCFPRHFAFILRNVAACKCLLFCQTRQNVNVHTVDAGLGLTSNSYIVRLQH